ncbi:AMP-binding protein [Geomesophilobacter sediminis]|uniref:AMP-binding protein n=1 Tax=Geomesophilobacter sediminis TaxID=2798584 RepID=A0A8J7IPM1_9BACT|nr:AMP-binding protein [Geomesophilobacter sediminis]MBJ6724369.1 AMP-binding protein [Geomesophilobacter sediminis]
MKHAETIGTLLRRQHHALGARPFLSVPDAKVTLSFSETYRESTALAVRLTELGAGAGDRVALLFPNGVPAALGLMAVFSVGAVAVPLNPRLTPEEIRQALELSGARLILCPSDLGPAITAALRGVWSRLDGGFTSHLNGTAIYCREPIDRRDGEGREATADDPALILFTSGTTGTPKGVVLSHANLLANAGFVRKAHRLTPDDVALCILPLFHINGLVVTLLTPLLTGMPVLLPTRFEVGRFWEWIREHRVTWFSAVPTILSLLLSHPDPPREDLATLRFARSASAPLPVPVLKQFERRFEIPVIETYGISEAACQVTANPHPPGSRKPGSAGIPVGNRLQVLNGAGHPVAAGTVGEVVIAGVNVFAGYLDNPAADREALKNGWFHTGDLGYLDADGFLFLTGRKKELINRAGEKISPREVEEVVHRLPEVETVGVVGVPHQLYGEEVTAFITLRQGSRLTTQQVRDFCREHLAGYKVPREVFFIPEFPCGPSGKVQRRRLLEVYTQLKEQKVHP